MPPSRKLTPEQEDRARGMAARGESYRVIGEALGVSASSVSRAINPSSRETVITPPRPSPPIPRPSPRLSAEPATPEPPRPPPEPIVISEDPRELERADWIYYETLKITLRRRAEEELERGNLRGYQQLLKASREAEERAAELRPPTPPDPDKDPTYRVAARQLTTYLEALVAKAERSEVIPHRDLPPTKPVAV